jgi:hypothetical protein
VKLQLLRLLNENQTTDLPSERSPDVEGVSAAAATPRPCRVGPGATLNALIRPAAGQDLGDPKLLNMGDAKRRIIECLRDANTALSIGAIADLTGNRLLREDSYRLHSVFVTLAIHHLLTRQAIRAYRRICYD